MLADRTSRPLRLEKAHWRKEQGGDARSKIHKKKPPKIMKYNKQTAPKEPSHSLHYTTQRTHARLFSGRGAACHHSFSQPSGEY